MDFDYVQPALSAGQKPITGLWLTISPQRASRVEVPSGLVTDILHDYVKYAMCIENPKQCKEYQAMESK